MTKQRQSRSPVPIDEAALDRLALDYAARYATTRAKLAAYLARKLRERGWAGDGAPAVDRIVERLAGLGFVDDRAFAEARGAALSRRGLGPRRVAQALRQAGITEDDAGEAVSAAAHRADETALAYARRRRIGPFHPAPATPEQRGKWLAAMARAGHDFAVARRVLDLGPDEFPNPDG